MSTSGYSSGFYLLYVEQEMVLALVWFCVVWHSASDWWHWWVRSRSSLIFKMVLSSVFIVLIIVLFQRLLCFLPGWQQTEPRAEDGGSRPSKVHGKTQEWKYSRSQTGSVHVKHLLQPFFNLSLFVSEEAVRRVILLQYLFLRGHFLFSCFRRPSACWVSCLPAKTVCLNTARWVCQGSGWSCCPWRCWLIEVQRRVDFTLQGNWKTCHLWSKQLLHLWLAWSSDWIKGMALS